MNRFSPVWKQLHLNEAIGVADRLDDIIELKMNSEEWKKRERKTIKMRNLCK